jgi:SAM-dependent methyltransferase
MRTLSSPLVRPLEEPFQPLLDDLARAHRWPTSTDTARLGALVRRLSDAYNSPDTLLPRGDDALAARLLFSFPRDVPKGAAAVRELVASGALCLPAGRPLRVLDMGAGLGATTRGVARALAAAGAVGAVRVDALDADDGALALASAIARARPREGDVTIDLHPVRASVTARLPVRGPYDLVVLGQLLSELAQCPERERVERHAALLLASAEEMSRDGALVVIEPALRDRTRHLHAVRDAVLAAGDSGLRVFAPCVHDAPCPAIMQPDAWCHEDLDVDLPSWLVPVAKAAGLRWQGLTFSYLVLRRDDGQRSGHDGRPASPLRVVSSPIVTKGKRELFLCGLFDGAHEAVRLKVMRLDRHRVAANQAWDEIVRGDILALTPSVSAARPRVDASTAVVKVETRDREPRGG